MVGLRTYQHPGIVGCVGPRASFDCAVHLATTGIRNPNRPARSELLYRLSYRGPLLPKRNGISDALNQFLNLTKAARTALGCRKSLQCLHYTKVTDRERTRVATPSPAGSSLC